MAEFTGKRIIEKLLLTAGVTINGDSPWDIRVHNDNLYRRVLTQGSLGLGEAYMDGWWDCKALDQFFYRVLSAGLDRNVKLTRFTNRIAARILNLQARSRAFQIGRHHYDIGNDLYRAMLDRRMVYSCAYWKNVSALDEAQEAKLDLICRKIGVMPGMKILDIGCGWGSFARYAAEKYGASVVGITVSKEQVKLAEELCSGLPVEIRFQDYRNLDERFDHIVSIGMIEHVGYKNYRTYMEVVHRCLNDSGLFLLQTIGGNRSVTETEAWIAKYIFPNSQLPSFKQLSDAAEDIFVIEDWHNFGTDYDKTLMAWYRNFTGSWDILQTQYDDRFYRMWTYYLLSCAGSFRARENQLWQVVFSKNGVPGGYASVR